VVIRIAGMNMMQHNARQGIEFEMALLIM
jgi:hypothetical protein